MRNEWIQSRDAWTTHELNHNSLDGQTCYNPKNRYNAHIRHYRYSQVMHKWCIRKSGRRKEKKEGQLSLYQGRHHADDRQGIERCEANEYNTSAGIKTTAEWTSLMFAASLSHDGHGIEGSKWERYNQCSEVTLKGLYKLAHSIWQFWDPIWTTAVYKGCHELNSLFWMKTR